MNKINKVLYYTKDSKGKINYDKKLTPESSKWIVENEKDYISEQKYNFVYKYEKEDN